jgi:hypothetical protein
VKVANQPAFIALEISLIWAGDGRPLRLSQNVYIIMDTLQDIWFLSTIPIFRLLPPVGDLRLILISP